MSLSEMIDLSSVYKTDPNLRIPHHMMTIECDEQGRVELLSAFIPAKEGKQREAIKRIAARIHRGTLKKVSVHFWRKVGK